MMISDILNHQYTLLTDEHTKQNQLNSVYATDLLSQAILAAKSHQTLITMISNINTIGVAVMMDLPCIIISCGKPVTHMMIDQANEEGIALIQTPLHTHEVILDLQKRGML